MHWQQKGENSSRGLAGVKWSTAGGRRNATPVPWHAPHPFPQLQAAGRVECSELNRGASANSSAVVQQPGSWIVDICHEAAKARAFENLRERITHATIPNTTKQPTANQARILLSCDTTGRCRHGGSRCNQQCAKAPAPRCTRCPKAAFNFTSADFLAFNRT